jgi:hypothetical protein
LYLYFAIELSNRRYSSEQFIRATVLLGSVEDNNVIRNSGRTIFFLRNGDVRCVQVAGRV